MKNLSRGFTLVELVVVIAIIGVLAAILIPSMLNYVKKTRLRTANTNAKTAYNAVAAYVSESDMTASKMIEQFGDEPIDCTTDNDSAAFNTAQTVVREVLVQNGVESGFVYVTLENINSSDSFCVHWARTETDETVGQYPDAVTWDNWNENSGKRATLKGGYVSQS